MRFEEKIHQQPIDLRIVAIDLVILRRMPPRRVLEAIQRALAGQRLAVGPQHRAQLPRQHRKRRVLAQLVVIVEVFVAQCQAEDALPYQRLDLMLDIARVAPVDEAVGEATHQPEAPVDLSQQRAPAFEVMFPPSKPAIIYRCSSASNSSSCGCTLCLASGCTSDRGEIAVATDFLEDSAAPMHLPLEKSRLDIMLALEVDLCHRADECR